MKKESKAVAEKKINEFFKKDSFSVDELKKIKKTAMKYNIKLGVNRKRFCKKCSFKLEGKIRISKIHKYVTCNNCTHVSKFKI